MRYLQQAFAIFICLIGFHTSAAAIPRAFEFSGSIAFNGLGFSNGDSVTGRLVYETDIADASPDPNFGQFGPNGIVDISLTVDGNPLVGSDLAASDYIVNRFGNDRVTFRNMNIAFDNAVSDCDDALTCLFSLVFIDLTDAVLATDAPPTVGELSQFDVVFGVINVGSTSVNFDVDQISEVQLISEPSPALLFLAGLIVFGAARWGESVVGRR